MIQVKNISSSKVTLICTPFKFRRPMLPYREIPVAKDVYDELTFDPGFQSLVQNGVLKVTITGEEKQDTVPVESSKTVATKEEIEAIFTKKDYSKFAKIVANAAQGTKELIVSVAVANKIVDDGFVSLIKKYCGTDILTAISAQSD